MKRLVVKVGSSTIAHKNGLLNLRKMENLAKVLSDLSNEGYEIVLVSSGAVAAGRGKLHLEQTPTSTSEKQAIAAVGQCELMYLYDKFFSQYSKNIGQMLMTKKVMVDDTLRINATNTINTLLSYKAIPIINENDSVAIDELVYGDNDTLSAITAQLVCADMLVILSDVDGLYTKNPFQFDDAEKLDVVSEITAAIEAMAQDTNSEVGTGGMITKLTAARLATSAGVEMIICNGKDSSIMYDIVEGKAVGTKFLAKEFKK